MQTLRLAIAYAIAAVFGFAIAAAGSAFAISGIIGTALDGPSILDSLAFLTGLCGLVFGVWSFFACYDMAIDLIRHHRRRAR